MFAKIPALLALPPFLADITPWIEIIIGKGQLALLTLLPKERGKNTALPQKQSGKTDEFIEPCVLPVANGKTCEVIDHDAMIFFNFRPDRAKQLAKKFKEECHAQDFSYITMTGYDKIG